MDSTFTWVMTTTLGDSQIPVPKRSKKFRDCRILMNDNFCNETSIVLSPFFHW